MRIFQLILRALGALLNVKPKPAPHSAPIRKQAAAAPNLAPEEDPNESYGTRQPGPCTLRIRYAAASGQVTERDIAPYKKGATDKGFGAWCSLRKSKRNFIFSRIQSAVDLQTGEVLSAAQVFRRVHLARKVPEEIA